MIYSTLTTDELRTQVDAYADYPIEKQRQHVVDLQLVLENISNRLFEIRHRESVPFQNLDAERQVDQESGELLCLQARVDQLFATIR